MMNIRFLYVIYGFQMYNFFVIVNTTAANDSMIFTNIVINI